MNKKCKKKSINIKNMSKGNRTKYSFININIFKQFSFFIKQFEIRYRLFKYFFDLVQWYLLRKLQSVRVSSAMFTFCLFMFWLHTVVKQENCSIQTEETCPSLLLILRRHYRHIFTAIYPFHKINSSRHTNIMAFEIRYYNANS